MAFYFCQRNVVEMVMHTECLVVKTVFWVVSGVPVDLSLRVNSYWCGFCQPSSWRRLWCMCDMNAQSWWSDVELTQSFWWTSSFVYLSAYLWMRKCVYMRVSFTIALSSISYQSRTWGPVMRHLWETNFICSKLRVARLTGAVQLKRYYLKPFLADPICLNV